MVARNEVGIDPRRPLDYVGAEFSFLPCYQAPRRPLTTDHKEQFAIWRVGVNSPSQTLLNGVAGEWWYLSYYNTTGQAIWLMMSTGGAGPLTQFTVDTFSGTATSTTVIPNGSGNVTINGALVTAGTNPVRTDTTASFQYNLEIQKSQTGTAGNPQLNGLSYYNQTEFTVTSDGLVSLIGGGASIQQVTGNDTLPVVPTLGNINVLGAVVANSTDPTAIYVKKTATSTETIDVQVAAAIASTDVTKVGLSSYKSTQFNVDSLGFVSSLGNTINPGFSNIGINQSSGTTFTVQGFNGTALSASNPGILYLQSKANPGQLVRFNVTANQLFTQAQLGNSLFGLTSGVSTGAIDIPFFLYATSNANTTENSIAFMISRVPHLTQAPLAANIGQSGNTNASTQASMFSLATITAADYASSPCICVGSFRMRYASSLWTVQSFVFSDGIGLYQDGVTYTFPRGQFGAASGKWFLDNGGTAPNQDAPAGYAYYIRKSGFLDLFIAISGITTAGVGGGLCELALPFVAENGGSCVLGFTQFGGAGAYSSIIGNVAVQQFISSFISVSNGGTTAVTNATVSLGTVCSWQGYFKIGQL